jgi:hypothetical protein
MNVQSVPIESCSWRGVLDTSLYDEVYQWLVASTSFSSTNKADRHDINEIFFKVALTPITLNSGKNHWICEQCQQNALYYIILYSTADMHRLFHGIVHTIPFIHPKADRVWYEKWHAMICLLYTSIRVITKLPNSEQSSKGKVKTHKYINRQHQSTTGKLGKP